MGLTRQAIGNRVTSIRKKYAELYFERGKKNES